MTRPETGDTSTGTSAADDWIEGRRRFDQIAYDWLGIKDKLAGRTWLATWAGHVYKRDRTAPEAFHKIAKWIVVDAAVGYQLERKYPKFLEKSKTGVWQWRIYCAAMVAKNMANFNTLFLTAMDSSARAYVTTLAHAYEATSKGEFPAVSD